MSTPRKDFIFRTGLYPKKPAYRYRVVNAISAFLRRTVVGNNGCMRVEDAIDLDGELVISVDGYDMRIDSIRHLGEMSVSEFTRLVAREFRESWFSMREMYSAYGPYSIQLSYQFAAMIAVLISDPDHAYDRIVTAHPKLKKYYLELIGDRPNDPIELVARRETASTLRELRTAKFRELRDTRNEITTRYNAEITRVTEKLKDAMHAELNDKLSEIANRYDPQIAELLAMKAEVESTSGDTAHDS